MLWLLSKVGFAETLTSVGTTVSSFVPTSFSYMKSMMTHMKKKSISSQTSSKAENWGFHVLSISPVITSEGRSGFYTAFGLSIAVILFSFIQPWMSLPTDTTEGGVTVLLTIAAISGLVTGLLFVVSPDRIMDIWVEGKAKYTSWHEFSPLRKIKNCNRELQRLIAYVDQITSNWDRSTWISTSDICLSIVESSIDAPQIQKVLWDLKRKAGIGILFIVWSITIWIQIGTLELYWILLSVLILGLVIFLHTLFWGTATKVVRRVCEFSLISYTKESLQSYQPVRYQVSDPARIDIIDRLKESARVIEQVATAGQWKRFDEMYTRYLNDMKILKPRITNTEQRLSTAWYGAFTEHHISKSAGRNELVLEHKIWFNGILEAYDLTGDLRKLNWKTKPNIQNYTDPEAFFTLNLDSISLHRVYRSNDNIGPRLIEAFQVQIDEDKVLWINLAAEQDRGFPDILKDSIYEFVCHHIDLEFLPDVFVKLTMKSETINLESTTEEMIVHVKNTTSDVGDWKTYQIRFFDKVQGHSRIPEGIRQKARRYLEAIKSNK